MKDRVSKIEKVINKKPINANDQEVKKEFLELVKEFIQVISENLGEERLKLFYKNLKKFNFKVEDIDVMLMNKKSVGEVELKAKKFEIKSLNSVFHELLHLATIYRKGHKEFCGFQVTDIYTGRYKGLALNEGYTQLLADKYFNRTNQSYQIEEAVVWFVEKLIGEEKMEDLYFNCDLDGLQTQLKKYSDDSSLFKFNWEMESFSYYFYLISKYDSKDIQHFDIFFRNVGSFLANCFIEKIKLDEISKEEVKNYINYMNMPIKFPNVDFEFRFILDKAKYLTRIDNIKSNKK